MTLCTCCVYHVILYTVDCVLRSAAWLQLGDNESALADALTAVAIDATAAKAHYRMAQALIALAMLPQVYTHYHNMLYT
jgi:hypothetical protein